jgi:NAD+ synthase (glutamine-hydrolysing)
VGAQLFNCAAAVCNGQIRGVVPKSDIPNYNEFYEGRYFAQADGSEPKTITFAGYETPFGIDLLFRAGVAGDLIVFAEICESVWMPIPPSSVASLYGANLLVNLSASNETVAKNEYRRDLVVNQSGRCVAAYAYASTGPSESTGDTVHSGHCLIAENGSLLIESSYIGDGKLNFAGRSATADIDVQKLNHDRRVQGSFGQSRKFFRREFRSVQWTPHGTPPNRELLRPVPAYPFVPQDPAKLRGRCAAVFDIQCAALSKRLDSLMEGGAECPNLSIGISGGLDSTLALLVLHKVLTAKKIPLSKIKAITMPGFGTTKKTKGIANRLMKLLGIEGKTIDIREDCMQKWRNAGHSPLGIDLGGQPRFPMPGDPNYDPNVLNLPIPGDPNQDTYLPRLSVAEFEKALAEVPKEKRHDLRFENVQARTRTEYLMDAGFVIGTGDLSELALGWCTYNGDHMSMYNVNCSVPKTLVQFMVRYVANNHYPEGETRTTLNEVADLVISPELLPPDKDGNIEQSTEDTLGPYPLHDFFLANTVRNGYGPEKIFYLTGQCDHHKYPADLRKNTLRTFVNKFLGLADGRPGQQFKRDCVPNGPKVGSVSLSPRGDWRAPADGSAAAWHRELDMLEKFKKA